VYFRFKLILPARIISERTPSQILQSLKRETEGEEVKVDIFHIINYLTEASGNTITLDGWAHDLSIF